jgi:hypothetical protein
MKTATKAGQWFGDYQAVSPAPLSFSRGRTHEVTGHLVSGAWRDPWWAYAPGKGWAVVRRWHSPATDTYEWQDGHVTAVPVPECDETEVTPVPEWSEDEQAA